jgi:hypothetical protein
MRTNFVDADAREWSFVTKALTGSTPYQEGWEFTWAWLPADLGVALGVLLAFAVVCEWAAGSVGKPSSTKGRLRASRARALHATKDKGK